MFGQMMDAIDDDYLRYVMHVQVVTGSEAGPDLTQAHYEAAEDPSQGPSLLDAFRATAPEAQEMVAAGAGVTLLPELAGRGAYRSARGVVLRPFAKPAPVRHIGALWRKTTAWRAAIDALCKLIAEHAL